MENEKIQINKNLESLLQKIESNEITSHSKNYFRLRIIAFIASIVAIFILSIFLGSFILFSIRVSGQASLVGLGGHGLAVFLKLFPWGLFVLDIILIIFAGWLLRSFRFGYKIPVVYFALGIIAIMGLAGTVVDRGTTLHYTLLHNSDIHHLPLFEKMYHRVRLPPPPKEGIFRGIITSINGNTFIVNIESETDETTSSLNVIIPPAPPLDFLKVGDNIFIAGDMINGNINARVIQLAPKLPDIFE